jgi:tetratricopeptide (TPR) repeat protein
MKRVFIYSGALENDLISNKDRTVMNSKSGKNIKRKEPSPERYTRISSEADKRSGSPDKASCPSLKMQRNKLYAAAVCVFLLLAVALVFGQTIGHEFVNCDDNEYVYENPQVKGGLTARGIVWAFTAVHSSNWHPMTWLTLMLDVQLFGMNPAGHHLTNVLLHATSVILLFLVLWRMTGALWKSAFVAAVFAIHPLRAESVAWISERKDVLSGLFFMLTLWAYNGYARRPFSLARYLTVAGLFALGLMSKPMLVTLPFVLLLLDYWPLGRIGTPAESGTFSLSRRVIVEKLPLFALVAASCVVTFFAQTKFVVSIDTLPISSRIANTPVAYMAYIGKFFYPVGLAVFYPYPRGGLPVWGIAFSTLALAGISAAAIVWRRRFPYLFVGWFWYLGMLVPVIGLVQAGLQMIADRYTYLPQIGLCLAMTWGIAQFASSRRRRRWICGVALTLAVMVLMGMAWRQTSYWRNSETLWTHAKLCTENNYLAYNYLGAALAKRGEVDKAIAQFQKAVEIWQGYAEAHGNLGSALAKTGRVDEALSHFNKALDLRPNDANAHNNLGAVLAGTGQIEAAIAHYQKALEINPVYAEAHNNLGIASASCGRIDEGIFHFKKALEIKPDEALTHNNLGIALTSSGRIDEAIAYFQKALEINPGSVEARNNLDKVLQLRRQREQAGE